MTSNWSCITKGNTYVAKTIKYYGIYDHFVVIYMLHHENHLFSSGRLCF